ncbi:MAG: tetratricopeptide repeat protein [Planctomycetales bacterium]
MAVLWIGSAQLSAAQPPTLGARITQAERILIATPKADVTGNQPFLVEIDRALRGAGKDGQTARIFSVGKGQRPPRFQKGQKYVFLLHKNADGKGWGLADTVVIPVTDDRVQVLVDGQPQEDVSLDELDELIVRHEYSVVVGPPRESVEGRWTLAMSQQGSDYFIWLIDISREPSGEFQARLVDASKVMESSTLKGGTIAERELRLELIANSDQFEFVGRLEQGVIRGNILVAGQRVLAARMAPSELTSMRKYAEAVSAPARDAFVAAVTQEESFEPLRTFARRYAVSPMALEALQELMRQAISQRKDEAAYRKIATEYVKTAHVWGSRMATRATMELGVALSQADLLPELSLEYLRSAERMIRDDDPREWMLVVQIEIGKRLLRGDDPEEGQRLLLNLRRENPFLAEVNWLLALHAQHTGDIDTAMELFAELSVLPMLEQEIGRILAASGNDGWREQMPSRILTKLWSERHPDNPDVRDYLDETYRRRLTAVAGPARPPRSAEEGTRVTLCELFTGTDHLPCVAAEVAVISLQATHAQSEVVVLRYHEHFPRANPLANEATDTRFASYLAKETPWIAVNGKQFSDVGGLLSRTPEVYQRLNQLVEPYLKETTVLSLDLTAQATDGIISMTAQAKGLPEFPGNLRLRLALAETELAFVTGNGLRTHRMVVRDMPGGPDGIAPERGALRYTGEVDLGQLKSDLGSYLARIETDLQTEMAEKPMEFQALCLVGFLQDIDTGEVVQARAIPVEGDVSTPKRAANSSSTPGERSKPSPGAPK